MDGTDAVIASYEPLQGWSNSKKYTFFAFYPYPEDDSPVSLVNTDGSPYTGGIPSIKYSLNTTEDPNAFTDSMVDVMVAPCHVDLDGSSDTTTGTDVTFAFAHCLSCLGLNIKNSSAGSITVNSVSIKVSGLEHQDVIIPLDGSASTYGSAISTAQTCTLAVANGGVSIPKVTEDPNGVELDDKLIFIPQSDDATVQVTVAYTRAADGYTQYNDTFTSSPLSTSFTKGKKHIIYLNFTDSTVEIGGDISESAWVEIPNVDSTFN